MVQGGLLTAHPGSVHGYGWSPGGGVSLRQGAGAASPGSPDLETAAAAEQRRDWKRCSLPRGSSTGGKYRQPWGHQGPRRPLGAAPLLVAPPGHMGPWWVPSGSHLIIREAS